jgi:hypothetical protein
MVSHSLVIGYHGCDIEVARQAISLQEPLKPSQNAWDWLGHAIYFWEDSPARAEKWSVAECRRQSSKIKHPAVLGAVIDLGRCLNLTEAEALADVKTAHEEYSQACRLAPLEPAQNRGPDLRVRYLDCAVMETLHRLRHDEKQQPYDTVRGFFMEGHELYPDAGFRELDHIQICVRAPRQIIGCFWPRPGR